MSGNWRRTAWAFFLGCASGAVIGLTTRNLPDWGVVVAIAMAATFSWCFPSAWPVGHKHPKWSVGRLLYAVRCPEHGKLCSGPDCCCADLHWKARR